MPELPEVETIRRQLSSEIIHCTIAEVRTDNPKMFRPSFKAVLEAVKGRRIEFVDRQAKLIIFNLSGGLSLLFHLKLTGRLLLRQPNQSPDDYVHAVFTLNLPRLRNGSYPSPREKELRFADARKFGFIKIVKSRKELDEMLSGFGPEPFRDLTLDKLYEILDRTSRPVKLILIDQEKISGIGNIYAAEALWLAKINPRKPGNTLSKKRVNKLFAAILEVLRRGLKYGGASDQWYRQIYGQEGRYQEHFLVYGKAGEPCSRCGAKIRRIEINHRGTYYCPRCQTS